MNQIKSDDTVISPCVGRLLVSVLLTPSLTPDFFFFLSIDLGPLVLIDLEKKVKDFRLFESTFLSSLGILNLLSHNIKKLAVLRYPSLSLH